MVSTLSEPKSEPSILNSRTERAISTRRTSLEPKQRMSINSSNEDNRQTPIIHITQGPPIILDNAVNVSKRTSDDVSQTYSSLTKRRRAIVEEIDELKRDLLVEELNNSKKIGLVLDEALGFMKRLNQTNGVADKLSGIINGH